jgi:hypothetical protein
MVWGSQVSHFLSDHSGHFQLLESPTAGQAIAEDMELFEAEGWQTNAAAVGPAK